MFFKRFLQLAHDRSMTFQGFSHTQESVGKVLRFPNVVAQYQALTEVENRVTPKCKKMYRIDAFGDMRKDEVTVFGLFGFQWFAPALMTVGRLSTMDNWTTVRFSFLRLVPCFHETSGHTTFSQEYDMARILYKNRQFSCDVASN